MDRVYFLRKRSEKNYAQDDEDEDEDADGDEDEDEDEDEDYIDGMTENESHTNEETDTESSTCVTRTNVPNSGIGHMLLNLMQSGTDEMTSNEETNYLHTLSRCKQTEYRRQETELAQYKKKHIPIKCQIVQLGTSVDTKICLYEKLHMLNSMEQTSSEYAKLNMWLDAALKIPFGKYEAVPVTMHDTTSTIRGYLRGVQSALDTTVYGHKDAKSDIIELVSQWISNPRSMSQVIGISGPPGTGKTTLVRHGIAKALGRPFVQISLGGATDACTLNGHSYTYEGSIWGRIAAALMSCKCMNPVLFFDEVDKISESKTGQEIVGILIHLTDSTQNDQFYDRFFDGLPLDLSRALIIFSFNNAERLCPILKDRMRVVNTGGFTTKDKCAIVRQHILPAVLRNTGFDEGDIRMEDDNIKTMIDNVHEEKGVRNLKRGIEKAVMKLNVLRLTGGSLRDKRTTRSMNSSPSVPDIPYSVTNLRFPMHLDNACIQKLVPKPKVNSSAPMYMYM